MSNEIIYRQNRITNADLVSGNCLLSHAMTGDTLAADTLDFRIWSDTGLGKVDADFLTADEKTITTQDGKVFRCFVEKDLTDFVAGDSVEYKRDGKLVGKFYLRNVKRSYKFYDFTCISAIGILGDTLHYGGIYTGQTVAEVAAEILEGLPYEIDPIVGDIKLYGWLPIDTKRNNLQQITIATAIAVRTKPDGTLLLTALSNDIKGTIGANRMVVGANVEVDKPYSAVQVTEHYFQAIDEEIILFSESSVKTEFLKFNEPVHDLTVTGGTLIEWGANYAIVECNGFTEVKAKKYLHTTRTVTIGTVEGLPSDKIYSVNNATLINSLNSSGVAQKLYEAYTKPTTIQSNIFFGNERAGDVVRVVNPHTKETESAFLKKQDINISNLLLANSDFIVDFTPSGAVTGYKNRVLITEGTSWTVPAGVTEIRAILIGGGSGGDGGENGEPGTKGGKFPNLGRALTDNDSIYFYAQYNGDGGKGGKGGQPGDPGKVLDTGPLSVTPGETLPLSIGSGGTGGDAGQSGNPGGNTTFAGLSSANGQVMPLGYVDILTGDRFASKMFPGVSGQDGAGKNNLDLQDVNGAIETYVNQEGWSGQTLYSGYLGLKPPGYEWYYWYWGSGSSRKYAYSIGGHGGGGAYGNVANRYGEDGGSADDTEPNQTIHGGDGGKGSDGGPSKNGVAYGDGGYGGHGGGGGGGGGAAGNYQYPNQEWPGSGGAGGKGGKGGDGKQGCIIIYY